MGPIFLSRNDPSTSLRFRSHTSETSRFLIPAGVSSANAHHHDDGDGTPCHTGYDYFRYNICQSFC